MPDLTEYKRLTEAAEILVQRRDELQDEIDSINMDLQEYADQIEAIEEGMEVDTFDIELVRLTNSGFNVLDDLGGGAI